jgi:hypothetical protein
VFNLLIGANEAITFKKGIDLEMVIASVWCAALGIEV